MKRSRNRARVARALVAVLAVGAVLTQAPVAAEPTSVFEHTNPGVSASASSYGAPAIGRESVSEKTGAFTFAYPITVPPGRAGMAPSLSLSYSSAAPLFGDLAAGWTLGLPEIWREPGVGNVDAVGQPSRWRSSLGDGSRLISFDLTSSSEYRAWGDTSFTRYRRIGDVAWEAQALDGTVHRFENLPDRPAPNERFVLVSSTDRFGNAVRYQWQRTLSPDGIPTDELGAIEYTHNDALGVGAFARVTFVRDPMQTCGAARVPVGARLEGLSTDGALYLRGALPLGLIRTEVRDEPGGAYRTVREISLEYDGDAASCDGPSHSPMRLLTSIQERARSRDGVWTTMPATTLDYGDVDQIPWILRKTDLGGGKFPIEGRDHAISWGHDAASGSLGSKDWSDTYGLLVDLDGDGSQDRVVVEPHAYFEDPSWPVQRPDACLARVYRNARGVGFATTPYELVIPSVWHGRYCSLSAQPYVPPYGNEPPGAPTVGNGEASPINVFRFVDLDSDGLTDLVSSILLETGDPGRDVELPPHPNCDPNVPNPDWVVCNGPGTDVPPRVPVPLHARQGQTYDGWYVWRWYRNTGSGQFSRTPTFVAAPIPLEVIGETQLLNDYFREDQSGLVDLDGDGHLDAVWVAPGEKTWLFWRGNGVGGFEGQGGSDAPFRWVAPRTSDQYHTGFDDGIRTTRAQIVFHEQYTYLLVGLHDVNGDGRVDLLAEDPDLDQDRLVAYLNTGDGFSLIPEEVRDEAYSSETLYAQKAPLDMARRFVRRVVDFNGDGTLDYVSFIPAADDFWSGAGRIVTQFGVGTSLQHGPTLEIPVAAAFGTGVSGKGYGQAGVWLMEGDLTDIDGDGYTDVVGNDWQFGFDPNQAPPGLLTTISSGRDATTEIMYASRTNSKVVYCGAPTCRGGAMMPRWVVSSVTMSSEGRSAPAGSSYFYRDPVVKPDETGQHAFRGFTRIDVLRPSTGSDRAKSVTEYDYSQDYRGLISFSRTVDEAGTVKDVTRLLWTLRPLGDSPWLAVPLLAAERRYVCQTRTGTDWAQAEACLLQDTGIESVHTWMPLSTSGSPSLVTAWVDGETRTTEAIGTARYRPRITRIEHTLLEDDVRYLLLQDETTMHEVVLGVEVLRAHQVAEYDPAGLGLPRETRTWIENAEYATTLRGHDPQTGNVLWEQKPEQYRQDPDAPDDDRIRTMLVYDAFAVDVAETENELGHRIFTTHDRATGVTTSALGPNAWTHPSCNTACEVSYEGKRVEIDGFGRITKTWDSYFDPDLGYQLRVTSTVSYFDTPGTWPVVEVMSYQAFDDPETATRDRFEIDATGLVLSELRTGATTTGQTPTTYEYTPAGQLLAANAPDPSDDVGTVEYRWEYDALGRETRMLRPDGTGTRTTHGVRTWQVMEQGTGADPGPLAWTTFASDVFGDLVAVTEWDFEQVWGGPTTHYQYDALGRMTRIQDPDDILTELTHDGLGRRRSIRRGDRAWSYGYDHNGNQTAVVVPHAISDDPLAFTTSIVYDDLDRPISRVQGGRDLTSTEVAYLGDGTAGWAYDSGLHGLGRLTSAHVATGGAGQFTRTYEYDARGNPVVDRVSFDVWNGTFSDTRELRRAFGAQNQLVGVEHADAVGVEPATLVELRHDGRGLPQQARWVNRPGLPPPGAEPDIDQVDPRRLAHITYDQGGRPLARIAPNFLHRQTWDRDTLGRVSSLEVTARPTAQSGWNVVASHALTYFSADDLRTADIQVAAGGTTRVEAWGFAYDPRHQLVGATSGDYDGEWTYTPGGRLLTVFGDLGSSFRDYTYVYTDVAQGDPETVDHIVDHYAMATRDLTWDHAGNLRQRGTSPNAVYRYDGADDLREARTASGATTTREVYWYDGGGQRQLALALDSAGLPIELRFWLGETEVQYGPTGEVMRTLAHVNLGDPVARIVDRTQVEYLFHDVRHDLIAVVDETGDATAAFTYTPWNESVHTLGGAADEHRRRFNGKEADATTGLSYYGFRYYDPALLLWNQADPLFRFAPDAAWGEPRRANLYAFSGNNPMRFYDPDGLQASGHCESCMIDTRAEEDPVVYVLTGQPVAEVDDHATKASERADAVVGKVHALIAGLFWNPGATITILAGGLGTDEGDGLLAAGCGVASCKALAAARNAKVGVAVSGVDDAAAVVPEIVAGTNKEMFAQALGHLKGATGNAAQKAAMFEGMAAQISSHTGGAWSATRSVGADGSQIFFGSIGHAIVISPSGQIFLGNVTTAGHFAFESGGVLRPVYEALKAVQ